MPIHHTQPAHLAALGLLFGIDPPTIGQARVLELGCAAGGNIIPLAARFPQARFTGIDLCQRHVEDGRQRIARLGLGNITLQQGDLAEFAAHGRQFDYVICHGVFSWVPRPVQAAIFRICAEVLAPNGMATISYNVLPGWHLRRVVREICLQHAGREGTPLQRVARARAALERYAGAAGETDPYGLLLRTEARRLRGMPSAYILGEFLSPENDPCQVQDFIRQAGQHGLEHLCEADLLAAWPRELRRRVLDGHPFPAGERRTAAEQQVDILTGRPFRRSILVRREVAAGRPDPARLAGLHMAAPPNADVAARLDGAAIVRDAQGRSIGAVHPAIRQALARLAAAYPATLTLPELLRGMDGKDSAAQLAGALFELVLAGQVSASALPLLIGPGLPERPRLWPVARVEAAAGQPWLTNLRHEGVPVPPLLRPLWHCLDGRHDHAALQARLAEAFRSGTVAPPQAGSRTEGDIAALAGRELGTLLAHLRLCALLDA